MSRASYPDGVFTLDVWGETYNIITSPSLIRKTRGIWELSTSPLPLQIRILRNVFGMSSTDIDAYLTIQPRLNSAFSTHLNSSDLSASISHYLSIHLPDLLTLNPSPVDQEPWERACKPQLSPDLSTATVSLQTLISTFLTHATASTLFSPSLLAQTPEIATHILATTTTAFLPLLTGAPRTLPHPALPAAHIARHSLAQQLQPFVRALAAAEAGDTPADPEYRDLLEDPDAVAPALRARMHALAAAEQQQPGWKPGPDARVADVAALLCGLARPLALPVWLLLHLLAQPRVLDEVRTEASAVVTVVRPGAVGGFSVRPEVAFDVRGMLEGGKCPRLMSAWVETVRVYGRGLESRRVEKGFCVEGEGKGEVWAFERGEHVSLPLWMANADPAVWREPERWIADRHVRTVQQDDGSMRDVVDEGSVLHECESSVSIFSPGSCSLANMHLTVGAFGFDDARPFTDALSLSFVAAFLVLWDLEPAEKNEVLPKSRFAPGVALPRLDIKVNISKREVSAADADTEARR